MSETHVPADEELVLRVMGPIALPIVLGETNVEARWYVSARDDARTAIAGAQGSSMDFARWAASTAVNSVLEFGDPRQAERPLVRIHSSCLTGDLFGSQRCECGPQFVSAVERMVEDPSGGYLIYMAGHEGRGIGLWAKAATYLLQDAGQDTYQANQSLGLPEDSRDFSEAAALLKYFRGGCGFRLLTNNPDKIESLAALGIKNAERVKHVVGVGHHNRRYLVAKRDWGHHLSEHDLES